MDYKSYFNKAIQTCKDNNTTGTTWYFNFITAIDELKAENEKVREAFKNLTKVVDLLYSANVIVNHSAVYHANEAAKEALKSDNTELKE